MRANFDAPDFQPGRTALFLLKPGEGLPAVETCAAADDVRLESWQPNQVRTSARMACKGLVVLADTWYPGWQAKLDGRPVRIWEVDGLVRGIEVPAGDHRIEIVYRPNSVLLGAVFSGAALLAAIAAAFPFLGGLLAKRFQSM